MTNTDTAFAEETELETVDPAYLEVFGSAIDDTEEAEREVGLPPIPRFDLYHVHFEGATSGFSKNKGTAFVRPTVKVLHGPTGTTDRLVSDDIYFAVSDTVKEKDKETGEYVERPRTQAERIKAVGELKKTLKRIATRLDLTRTLPPSLTEDGLKAYASGFAGKEAILAIRVEKARGDFPAKNRIIWRSIAGVTDAPSDEKSKCATALDESLAAIEKANVRQKGGTSTRTARGLKAAAASEFI